MPSGVPTAGFVDQARPNAELRWLLWGSRQASGRDTLVLFGTCHSRPGGVDRADLHGEDPHMR